MAICDGRGAEREPMERDTGLQIWSPRDDNAMESPHVEQVTVGNKTDARSSIRGATRDMVVYGGGLVRVDLPKEYQ